MTGGDLIKRVLNTVENDDLTTGEVLDVLNEGLMAVADRVFLPNLEATADVVTVLGDPQVAMPADYQHGLFDCQDEDRGNPIQVISSKKQLLYKYGDLKHSGLVRHVADSDGTLVYNPIPTTVRTLTVSYYRYPTPITETTEPVCLRAQYHRILFHYACYTFFDDIEEGMEGAKVNTDKHEVRYEKMLAELELRYKSGQSKRTVPVCRVNY